MPHAFSYDQKLIINIIMILIKKIPHFRKYLISLSENRIKNILYIKKNSLYQEHTKLSIKYRKPVLRLSQYFFSKTLPRKFTLI